jgi:cysteine synthase B
MILDRPIRVGLEDRVGKTPLVRLASIGQLLPAGVSLLAKVEWFNPSGSVKDRAALEIIRVALAEGKLAAGRRLLDSTSGNMGIAYATFGAALGIPVTLCVPASASPERLKVLEALGAEVLLTDPLEGSDGAIRKARAMAKEEPGRYWYANQYDNPSNWRAHFETTGPEIVAQTNGAVTHFVAGLGTSGTLMGVGRYLRQAVPHVKLVGLQPDGPIHGLEGLKHMPSAIKPGIYDVTLADHVVEVTTESAHEMVRRLAREEGLFAGTSSGAAAVAGLQLALTLDAGAVVIVFPDAGYKYLSDNGLWERP